MERILFLYNAHAGKGTIKESLSDIIEVLINADYEVTIHSTKGRGDATAVSRERGEDYDIIIASGGDGTLSEVINGIMPLKKKPYVGFIPAGTTNDFAMNFKIPKDKPDAAKAITLGKPYAYDIGAFNGKFFNYVTSFGLFAAVSYSTPQNLKNILGRVAYLIEGSMSLTHIKSYKMTFSCGDMKITDEFIFGMVSNAKSVGGFKNVTGKNVTLNDGLFEVMLVTKPKSIIEFQKIVNALITMDFSCDNIYKFKTNDLVVDSEEEVDWTLDGEFGGSVKHAEIVNHPQAINFLVDENIIYELEQESVDALEDDDEMIFTSADEEEFLEKLKNNLVLSAENTDSQEQ